MDIKSLEYEANNHKIPIKGRKNKGTISYENRGVHKRVTVSLVMLCHCLSWTLFIYLFL